MPSTSHCASSLTVILCRPCYNTPLKSTFLYLTPRRFRAFPPPQLDAALTAFSSPSCCLPNEQPSTGIPAFFNAEQSWIGRGFNENKEMLADLQKYGDIRSKEVAEVMETLDRALFAPKGDSPYVDKPLHIGYNATISAPHMHAMCLELLVNHLKPGMQVLDIGSGTGYLTACFAVMVGPQGRAVGVEHIPELVEASIKNIERSPADPLLKEGSLSIHVGDGRQGWPGFAPYDAIHVGAGAPEIPPALIEQLKPGGRLVIPVGDFFQDLQVVDKNPDGSLSVHSHSTVRYIPLTSREAQIGGQ